MATAQFVVTFAEGACAVVGTAVAPSAPIPSNCISLVILNRGANDVLLGIAAPGVGTLTEGVNSTRLFSRSSITIPIGPISGRGAMDETILTGSGLVYSALVGATTLDITYQNTLGNSS